MSVRWTCDARGRAAVFPGMMRQCALLLGLLSAASCERPTQPTLLHVQTMTTVISEIAPDSSRIRFTITNASPAPVWLDMCGSQVTVAVERWDAMGWTMHTGGFCILSLNMAPARLGPGQSREGVHRIGARGTFRLRVAARTDPASEPDRRSASNSFEVR